MAILTIAITASAQGDPGGIFEVDLLFPGNSTYTPQPLMPVVFGLQNARLAPSFDASIYWYLCEGDKRTSPGSVIGLLELLDVNLSSSDPLQLQTRIVNTVAYPNGIWTLSWGLQFNNCTPENAPPQGLSLGSATVFTASKSGQVPDLVAATSPMMCVTGATNGIAVNATSFRGSCGVLAPNNATAHPCAATINSAAASSINAKATTAACDLPEARQQNPNITCPTSTGKPSAGSPDAAGRTVAASTLLILLATFTALIHLG